VSTPSITCRINASAGISERYFAKCDSSTG
jgi:hypothetical protein